MATYVNNLRLKEIATGTEEGTWGDSTNANLGLIADAFGSGTEAITTNANTHTTTIADGAADEGRAILLKYTGALDSDCTITIAPNTINKLWFIENATTDSGSSGPYNIIISQGSGANITITNGNTAAVMTDGAGATAAVLDAFADLELMTTLKVGGNTTVGGNATVNGALDLAGAANVDGVLDQNVADTVMHNMTNTNLTNQSWSHRISAAGNYELRTTDDTGTSTGAQLPLSIVHGTSNATFIADVHVGGALSKSSGSFKIDHPLELMKDTHHLVHSFIEGARADLIYRGSVQLSGGTATVDLDDAATMTHGTWELLCRDPQVWTQNEDGWTRVRGSVSGSTLTIVAEDGDCADTVSWLVVAERHDQHMMDTDWTDIDGRVLVEPTKDIISNAE